MITEVTRMRIYFFFRMRMNDDELAEQEICKIRRAVERGHQACVAHAMSELCPGFNFSNAEAVFSEYVQRNNIRWSRDAGAYIVNWIIERIVGMTTQLSEEKEEFSEEILDKFIDALTGGTLISFEAGGWNARYSS